MRSIFGGLCAALVTAVLAAPAPPVPAAAEPTPEPVRILLVGDSVTQGSAGDWTWRYRLWQHLAAAGVPVDLVGPRTDLYDNVADEHGSLAYADGAFDRDHAARWGMQVEVLDVPIADLVAEHRPDVVVEMLGFNDLYAQRTPETVAARIGRFVDEARTADPTVDVVLAEATQSWFPAVPELNARLRSVAAAATTDGSRVVVAATAAGHDALADTWDGSHPNARGEVRIAWAVADALHGLGVGPAADRAVPFPPVGPRSGARLSAVPRDASATLAWTGPPGATSQYVWVRDVTAGQAWTRLPFRVAGGAWTARYLTNGHRYDYRLQPVKGDDEPGGRVFSNVVRVAPSPPPGAPRRLAGDAGRRCAVLTWLAPRHARSYQVQRRTPYGWRTLGRTIRPRYLATGLPRAAAWTFRVRSWRGDQRGDAATVRVPRGGPAAACG
ncbi:lysophospholipase L1-like esterase [Nocardioides thalensis]|uniref:Lysophospholipase L1-like esterase n=1 Tax=Nocardioides thalensis TaxID=1914755 RepID=A0A853C429_9ACTN|nr:GDSL-type esterase/lipase family protein [Nocardioides thalensis]NYJ01053.1 lysophospholipase L1-like esterase [Nocardioides thalensis]